MLQFLSKLLFGEKPDIYKLVKERKAVVIDVRTPQEFSQGHAKGSKNIPLQEVERRMKELKKLDRPIVACCRSGNRSGIAARKLRAAGIEAYNAGRWQDVEQALNKK